MKRILCLFGFHDLEMLGLGGGFSFAVFQCRVCKCGIQRQDISKFGQWLTQKKMNKEDFEQYLKDHEYKRRKK